MKPQKPGQALRSHIGPVGSDGPGLAASTGRALVVTAFTNRFPAYFPLLPGHLRKSFHNNAPHFPAYSRQIRALNTRQEALDTPSPSAILDGSAKEEEPSRAPDGKVENDHPIRTPASRRHSGPTSAVPLRLVGVL